MLALLPRRTMTRLLLPCALVLTVALGACEEEAAAPADHTPASAQLFVNDVDVSANLVLPAGAVTRVEVRYYAADGDLIEGIEDNHHAALVFTAPTLATTAAVVDFNFQLDVTAQAAPGTGTVMVGYGHEVDADELSFGPFPVTVP